MYTIVKIHSRFYIFEGASFFVHTLRDRFLNRTYPVESTEPQRSYNESSFYRLDVTITIFQMIFMLIWVVNKKGRLWPPLGYFFLYAVS